MTTTLDSALLSLCVCVCVVSYMGEGLPEASQLMTRSSMLKTVTDSGCVVMIGGLLTAGIKNQHNIKTLGLLYMFTHCRQSHRLRVAPMCITHIPMVKSLANSTELLEIHVHSLTDAGKYIQSISLKMTPQRKT